MSWPVRFERICLFEGSCCALEAIAKPSAKTKADMAASTGSLITMTDAWNAKTIVLQSIKTLNRQYAEKKWSQLCASSGFWQISTPSSATHPDWPQWSSSWIPRQTPLRNEEAHASQHSSFIWGSILCGHISSARGSGMESVGASNCPSSTYSSRNFMNVMKVESVETTAAEGDGTFALISDNSGAFKKLGLRTSQKSISLPCSP